MKFSRIMLLASILLDCTLSAETLKIDARFFGKQTVENTAGANGTTVTRFKTESSAKAQLTASKRRSDLLSFGGLKELPGQNGLPPVIELKGTGCWLLGVNGKEFIEIFAKTRADAEAECARIKKMTPAKVNAYPRILDGYDKDGAAFWVGGGGSNYQLPDDFEWLKQHQFSFCTLNPTQTRAVAPGVVDDSVFEWHAKMAEKYDLNYRMLLFPSVFQWQWNRVPLPYITPMEKYTARPELQYMGQVTSGSEEPVIQTDNIRWNLRNYLTQTVGKSDRLNGWHGCTEIPTASVMHLSAVANTPGIIALYHDYLKNTLHLSLADVGQRYYGNPKKFKSWDDVKVPTSLDFIEHDPAKIVDLYGEWEIQYDPEGKGFTNQWYLPGKAPNNWRKTYGNDVMLQMYTKSHSERKTSTRDLWYRKTFTLPQGFDLKKAQYLHMAATNHHGFVTKSYTVYVNGQKCPELFPKSPRFSLCFDVGKYLRPGANDIVIQTGCNPLCGYIFLNDTGLKLYPYMGKERNLAWYDAVNFSAALRIRKIEDDLKSIRASDPVRPLKLMATINLLDLTLALDEKYGSYQHDTGGAGGYWCPATGAKLSKAHGAIWSCEQGGPPKDAMGFQKQVSFYLLYCNDAMDFVFACSHYTGKPDVKKWIDEHDQLLHCIGQMTIPQRKLALLRSARATRMGFSDPWNWDIGRGSLQATGRDYVYVEIPDLMKQKFIDRFPVIFDAGTVLMTKEDCKAIRRYVEAGGTFIAMHNTGIHLPEEANANPLAKEFGLTAVNRTVSPENYHRWSLEKITFEKDETMIPSLQGKTIEASGVAVDYLNRHHTGKKAIQKGNITPVARWSDGSVAIGEVKAGKGRFISIGTPFMYRAKDEKGVWINDEDRKGLLNELLNYAGVPPAAKSKNVWTDCRESKNGVFNLYVVSRQTNNIADTVTEAPQVFLKTPASKVIEIGANGLPEMQANWKDGILTLPEKTYTKYETKIFATAAADPGNSAMRWIRNQSGIWHAIEKCSLPEGYQKLTCPKDIIPLAENWKMADSFKDIGSFFEPKFNTRSWKNVKPGAFATMGYPENAQLLFRKDVKIPEDWQGRQVLLKFDCQNWFWGITPWAKLWINGFEARIKQPIVPKSDGSFMIDISNEIQRGSISVALAIDGTKRTNTKKKQVIPHGVTGLFYLQVMDSPLAAYSLEGPWYANVNYGDNKVVRPGQMAENTYFETKFRVPQGFPGKRIFIESDGPIQTLILNQRVISVPAAMRSLDVSGLLDMKGENVLRWMPKALSPAHRQKSRLGRLRLVWYP